MRGSPRVVPGKGYPKTMDAAWQEEMGKIPGKGPLLTFDAVIQLMNLLDPTGAVGPNHYVTACNSGFAIFDKAGKSFIHLQISPVLEVNLTNEDLGRSYCTI